MTALGEAGYSEVTLLGQNVDAYGRDLPGAASDGRRAWAFTELLRHVHDTPGIKRIRFATSHPRCALAACSFRADPHQADCQQCLAVLLPISVPNCRFPVLGSL